MINIFNAAHKSLQALTSNSIEQICAEIGKADYILSDDRASAAEKITALHNKATLERKLQEEQERQKQELEKIQTDIFIKAAEQQAERAAADIIKQTIEHISK